MAGDVPGYARVFTSDQDIAGQSLKLMRAGAIKMFSDVRSGRSMDRPGLAALLDYPRTGDTLAIVRLDRLGRSLAELLAAVAILKPQLWISLELFAGEGDGRFAGSEGVSDEAREDMNHRVHDRPVA